ncbi:MAG: response regulator, partial [Candidatus Hydrogenedentes bacterium]|nr:response regulator [Candidatus Hydrogenedentota bacterium]
IARRYRFPTWLIASIEDHDAIAETGAHAELVRALALATTCAADIARGSAANDAAIAGAARRLRLDSNAALNAYTRATESFARRMSLFAFEPAAREELQSALARFSNHVLLYWRVDETRAAALGQRVRHLDALLRLEKLAADAAPIEELLLACADGLRAALSVDAGLVVAWTSADTPVDVVRWGTVHGAIEPLRIDDTGARTIQRFLANDVWPYTAGAAAAPNVLPIYTPSRRHAGFVVLACSGGPDGDRSEHAREWALAMGRAIERIHDTAQDDTYRDALRRAAHVAHGARAHDAESGPSPILRQRNIARAAMAALHAPLSAVTSQAHRLVSRTPDADTQDLVEALAKDARSAARVMSDLQAIAGGGAPNEFVLINAPLRQFLHAARPRLERRSIGLTEQLAEGLPRIRADVRALQHLFTNLFAFIEQRMGHADRTIAVATAPAEDRAAVRVTIEAAGMALTQAQAETLFAPFDTRDGASSEFALALAACRAIAEENGGAIAVNASGHGALFTIAFDAVHAVLAVEQTAPPAAREVEVRAPVSAPPAVHVDDHGENPRVLVVDDDDTMRDLMKQALLRRGYRVETAKDGGAALRALDAAPFDAVLLDLLMPDRDGFAVLRELQRRDDAPPAIAMTGGRSAELRDEALALGAQSFLQKPFELGQLLAEVESLLVHQRR